jgi:hypothetical protein
MQGDKMTNVESAKAAAKQARLLKVCDGLHYSLEMLKLSYRPLWDTCNEIPIKASKAVAAMQYCWTFVDSIHRLRELAQSIPTVAAKHQEIRAFLGATEVAERFRHYIQHLRSELSKSQTYPSPVWGSLSWVDVTNPNVARTAFLGTDIAGTNYSVCGWDTQEHRFISKVTLGLDNLALNFDPMFEAAARFEKFINDYVKPKPDQMPVQPTGLPILSFEMIKAEGGYLVRMQKGVVVPPGTTAIRAPDIELKASFSSGDSVELRSVDSEIPAVPES